MPKYVVVGGSTAGIGAVEAIREVDPVGSLTLVSEEINPLYSRPLIGDFVSGEKTVDDLKYRNGDFWKRNSVQFLGGHTVTGLEPDKKIISVNDGNEICYEKLLLATGGKPFIPRIEGLDKDGVFTFTSFSDAERLASKIKRSMTALVVGGGLIGVSVAEALVRCGLRVTILELRDRLLNLFLDKKASNIVEKKIRKSKVRIVLGQTLKKIKGKQYNEQFVGGAVLSNNEELHTDIVVFAIGVTPRTELLKGTAININKGIVVDQYMATNVPDIYACGDAAEVRDFVLEKNRCLPLWPVAHMSGRVAGFNMAGKETRFPGGTAMNALKYFGLPIISFGLSNPEKEDEFKILVRHDSATDLYRKIVLKDNIIVGTTFVNEIEDAGIMFHLMLSKVNVGEFKNLLVSKDFGLASLPLTIRKKVFMGESRWGV